MIFAEIKHHRTLLVDKEYRSGCWAPSAELSGGVVQIQQTVHLATRDIQDRLADKDGEGVESGEYTYVVRPRSFLIVGSLDQLRGPGGIQKRNTNPSSCIVEIYTNLKSSPLMSCWRARSGNAHCSKRRSASAISEAIVAPDSCSCTAAR
ncbi:DUF4263 domain-containing protein [Mycolicibacterium novocastrense]|nr:DUF4263 domain-containing protein [Mycolicibacterium novocastrense]